MTLSRRAFSLGGLTALLYQKSALAEFQRSIGGKVVFRVPWILQGMDPHRLDDVGAQIFGSAAFNALYTVRAVGSANGIFPALAADLPKLVDGGYEVRLRDGLTTANGTRVTAADVVFSLDRARSIGLASALIPYGPCSAKDALTVRFARPLRPPTKEIAEGALAKVLSAPVFAIVPISFNPSKPDGTGPFKLESAKGTFRFVRNVKAILGVSMLDELQVESAPDLSASLRAFEGGGDDLGWLGAGLYGARAGSLRFDAGALGDIVFLAGTKAALWDVPGVPQEIVNGIDVSALRPFIADIAANRGQEQRWAKGPIELFTRPDPFMLELARAIAGSLSRPGNAVTVVTWNDETRRARLKDRVFPLALDFVRTPHHAEILPGARAHALVSTYAAQRARELTDVTAVIDPKVLARTHRFASVAEAKIQGATASHLFLPAKLGIEWGLVARGTP